MKVNKFNLKPLMFAVAAVIGLSTVSTKSFATSTDWWVTAQHTVTGKTSVNVKNFGAKGDGVHDDTAEIQAAIDSLPATGGTVNVPNGRYMINALKSVNMRSHTRLLMAQNAELHAIANSSTRYYIVNVNNVNNVRIVGGSIVGDRANHKGSTGEWGMGVGIYGSTNVVVKDIHISDCWGDGVMVASIGSGTRLKNTDSVAIVNVVSSNNRRQGLSITVGSHVYVANSTFSNTNGTLPMAGIDIEPQTQGTTKHVRMDNVKLVGNNGNGLELHANISDITLVNSDLELNHGFGILSANGPYLTIDSNLITKNGLAGVRLSGTHDVSLTNNNISFNSSRYISVTRPGGGSDRDLQLNKTTVNIVNSNNTFTPRK